MNKFKNVLLLLIFILYEEFIFMIVTTGFSGLILKILFSLQISLFFSFIFLFNKRWRLFLNILIFILPVIYITQYIYFDTFNSFLTIDLIFNSVQLVSFLSQVISLLISNIFIILLFLVPVFLYFIFYKKIKLNKVNLLLIIFIFQFVYLFSLFYIDLDKEEDIYSIKNLYHNINSNIDNLKEFGVLTTIRLDIQRTLFSFKEKSLYKYEDSDGNIKILDIEKYNMIDIDFDSLIGEETNDEIKEIHNYIKYQEPTSKNEYTGIFEGKNVIFVMGESFSSISINEELTPTLYKIANSGFKFNNFYTPLFPVSTSDGQYITDTSLIPIEGKYSMTESSSKYLPYSYGNVFSDLGYNTYAYHNYDYDFYDRNDYFKSIGFDNYLGCGNGLEKRIDCSIKFSSDYEMVKETINDYVNDEKFFTYYVTMSGHMNYDDSNNNVVKNWKRVEGLSYSEKARGYLATQIELDKALEEMIRVLKENDRLDDTVIVLVGDHNPYGLSEDDVRSLSLYDIDDYDIDKYHMPFIVYSEGMKEVEVNKYGSNLDVLPTMLNLFGITYDSRLLMGKDILSDSKSFVVFSNRSFINDYGIYNSRSDVFKSFDGINKDYSSYVKSVKEEIYLKYRYSRLMLLNDYYKYIFK